MKILAVSDITWNRIALPEFKSLVEKVRPDLVLLAGDLVDDKFGYADGRTFSPDKYWANVFGLFDFLSKKKIQTFYIEGNWDNSPFYRKIVRNKFPYVEEISGKTGEFGNLKILGLPHYFTNSLTHLRGFCQNVQEPFDIVLAHAEYKRRIWLFHLNCKLIITGHFDRQLCQIQDKVFISLENFPREYVVIDYESNKYTIQYVDEVILRRITLPVVHKTRFPWLTNKKERLAQFSNGQLIWKASPFRNRRQYANRIESLMVAKKRIISDKTRRQDIVNSLLKRGVPKRHIEEYISAGTDMTRSKKRSS